MKTCFILVPLLFFGISSFSQTAISLKDIPKHVGDSVVVTGKVVGVSNNQEDGSIVYQIGQSPDPSFSVLINHQNQTDFPLLLQKNLLEKEVRVTGVVRLYNSNLRIVVSQERQLVEILGQ